MKFNIIYTRWAGVLSLGRDAITLGHTVLVHPRVSSWTDLRRHILINHELIHVMQINELGVIKFYCLYVWFFLKYRSYRRIPFEMEAYHHQSDDTYREHRAYRRWELWT